MVFCGSACSILAHAKDGVLTKIEPADLPEPKYRFACSKALCSPKIVYHPDRLKYPMKRVGERGEGKWQRISWDEALDAIADKLKDISEKYGPEAIAYLTAGLCLPNGGTFSGQRFASASGATYVGLEGAGDSARPCADILNFGNRLAGFYLEDIENPRMCVIWGENMVETGGWRYRRIREAKENGSKVVVIDPRFSATAAKADEYVPIRLGSDAALALGMINVIECAGLCDNAFLTEYTVGPYLVRGDNGLFLKDSTDKYLVWDTQTNEPQPFDAQGVMPALRGSYSSEGIACKPAFQLLVELAGQYPLEKASQITGIPTEVIRELALDYATLKPVVSFRGLGSQRTFHGDLSIRAMTALSAVTGNISLKKPDGDVLSILNWIPFMLPGGKFAKQLPVLEFCDAVLTEKPYPIKAMWVSSHNPANSQADHNKFKEVMARLELIVVTELFMSATAEQADIVLPGSTPFESTNLALPYALFFGGHPYLQLQPKVIEPYHECKPDLQILSELAQRMGLGEFFNESDEQYIETLLASEHPAMEGITLQKLREGPLMVKPYETPLFGTPSGRLEFYVEKMKEFGEELPLYKEPLESARRPLARKYPLSFIQTHTKNRHHSMFANVDWLREFEPTPVLDINPADAKKRNIRDGDMVVAFNDRGKVKIRARIHDGIMPGVVNITEGWWPKDFKKGTYQALTHSTLNPAQKATYEPNEAFYDVLVEVEKA